MDCEISDFDKSKEEIASKSQTAGWTYPIVLAALAVFFGICVPCGYSAGDINTPSKLLMSFSNKSVYDHYHVVLNQSGLDVLWSSVVSIFLIGAMIGSFLGGWVADKIGRKGGMIVGGGIQLVAAVLFVTCKPANSVELFILARLVSGLGAGLATAVAPMFLMELSPNTLKGVMGTLTGMGVTFGVLLGQFLGITYLLGKETTWHYMLSFYFILVVVSVLAFPWMPESPKYLYSVKGDRQSAIKVMSVIRQMPGEWCLNELEENISDDGAEEPWSIRKLLSTRSMLLNVALTCALQAGQQLSGINAVFYYSVSLFTSAGLSVNFAQYSTLIFGSLSFIFGMATLPVVNNYPWRFLAILSCTLVIIFLVLLTICLHLIKQFSFMPYLTMVAVTLYCFSLCLGLGPIPYFIGSALFDVGPRPAAMALGSVASWVGNFIVSMSFPSLQSALGKYSFLIFAGFTALLNIFLILCLPEANIKVLRKRNNH